MSTIQDYYDFLINRVPHYDEQILASWKPNLDEWTGTVTIGICEPKWWECREEVRKLSEGIHFKPSRRTKHKHSWFPELDPYCDRMFKSWPDANHDWVPTAAGVGKPCSV